MSTNFKFDLTTENSQGAPHQEPNRQNTKLSSLENIDKGYCKFICATLLSQPRHAEGGQYGHFIYYKSGRFKISYSVASFI